MNARLQPLPLVSRKHPKIAEVNSNAGPLQSSTLLHERLHSSFTQNLYPSTDPQWSCECLDDPDNRPPQKKFPSRVGSLQTRPIRPLSCMTAQNQSNNNNNCNNSNSSNNVIIIAIIIIVIVIIILVIIVMSIFCNHPGCLGGCEPLLIGDGDAPPNNSLPLSNINHPPPLATKYSYIRKYLCTGNWKE